MAPSDAPGNHDGEAGVHEDVSLAVAPPAPAPSNGDPNGDDRRVGDTDLTVELTEDAVDRSGKPPPTAHLIEGESGDDLFNRLVLPEVDIMWRVAMSLTRNRADAEDLVQESLLRAYRAIDGFDGRYPRAWLLTIVRNTERNRHRRRRPELLNDPDMAEERGPATEADAVERRAEDREFDAAVTEALEQLPENFRSVVELVDVDGLTYQEAADVLEVPLGTVMSRLHRARRRIRELLVPAGFGPGVPTEADGSGDTGGGAAPGAEVRDPAARGAAAGGEMQR
jgi:RNA polymerase sigma-70 factor, ECF subfamily